MGKAYVPKANVPKKKMLQTKWSKPKGKKGAFSAPSPVRDGGKRLSASAGADHFDNEADAGRRRRSGWRGQPASNPRPSVRASCWQLEGLTDRLIDGLTDGWNDQQLRRAALAVHVWQLHI